MIKIFFIHL